MKRSLETLFERYRTRGDQRALGKIFDRTAPELLRVAMHFSRDPAVAEDLLQDTFLAAIEGAGSYDRSRPLLPWLMGILANQARRVRRSKARTPDASRLPGRRETDGAQRPQELEAELEQAIDALPDRYRQILLLRLGYSLEPTEIAHLLGMPPATVRTRVHRGLEKLRLRLPASLALGALPVAWRPDATPLRGLEAVREVVLRKAEATLITTGAGTAIGFLTVGGLVVTKKLAVVLGVALLALSAVGIGTRGLLSREDEPASLPVASSAAGENAPGLAAEGSARKAVADARAEALTEVPVAAALGWTLGGRVLGSDGHSISPAQVDAWIRRGAVSVYLKSVAVDLDGAYVIDLSEARRWSPLKRATAELVVRAHAEGHRPGRQTQIKLQEHAPGVPLEADLTLEAGILIMGHVRDNKGRPIVEADVGLIGVASKQAAAGSHTGPQGRYVLGVERGGAYVVTGHGAAGQACSAVLAVEAGATIVVPDLVLVYADYITGRLVSADDQPVAGFGIWGNALGERSESPSPAMAVRPQSFCRTGADGTFLLHVPGPGRYAVKADGYKIECEAGDRGVVLKVEAQLLRVRVRDPEGMPLPGATLTCMTFSAENASILDDLMAGTTSRAAAWAAAQTHLVTHLPTAEAMVPLLVEPGSRVHVAAYVPGSVPAERVVDVVPGQLVPPINLVIHEQVPEGRLTVTLTSAAGVPLRDFALDVESLGGVVLTGVHSDARGDLPPLPAGRCRIRIAPGAAADRMSRMYGLDTLYLPITRMVEIPEDGTLSLALRAEEGGRFRLALTYPEGERPDMDDMRVRVYSQAEPGEAYEYAGLWVRGQRETLHLTSDFPTGAPRLNTKLLPPGDYRVEFKTGAHGTHERLVRILAGAIVDVEIDLRD